MKAPTIVLLLLPPLAGCGLFRSETSIEASEIQPLVHIVAQRHDTYVLGDPALTQEQRDTALRSSRILVETVDLAVAPASRE